MVGSVMLIERHQKRPFLLSIDHFLVSVIFTRNLFRIRYSGLELDESFSSHNVYHVMARINSPHLLMRSIQILIES